MSVKLLRVVCWHWVSYHLTYGLELTGLISCWLFCLEYYATESVPDTHSKRTSWNIGCFRCVQSWTTAILLQLSDSDVTVSMRVARVW